MINLPTTALADPVVGIGTTTGAELDKFAESGLTADDADLVSAPLIRECHASFECRLHDASLVRKYDFFVWEVVKAHVAPTPRHPETLHDTGDGVFIVPGRTRNLRRKFRRPLP